MLIFQGYSFLQIFYLSIHFLACCMPFLFYHLRFHQPNSSNYKRQNKKCIVKQFSTTSCHFFRLSSTYSLQHLVLEPPPPTVGNQVRNPHKKNKQKRENTPASFEKERQNKQGTASQQNMFMCLRDFQEDIIKMDFEDIGEKIYKI